jgi:hypothetical protein
VHKYIRTAGVILDETEAAVGISKSRCGFEAIVVASGDLAEYEPMAAGSSQFRCHNLK